MLHRVPRGGVGLARLGCQLLLCVANTAAAAVVGAHGALARNTIVVFEAIALAALAVAGALVGALDERVRLVGRRRGGDPRRTLGAGAERAVVLGPRDVAVGPEVALALVVLRARAVPAAPVGAVGEDGGHER